MELVASKILSQVFHGAALMSEKNGGIQKLRQHRLSHDIPYIDCLYYQQHLAVVDFNVNNVSTTHLPAIKLISW